MTPNIIKINFKEINKSNVKENLYICCFLVGFDSFISETTEKKLLKIANKRGFTEIYHFFFKIDTEWNSIFNLCKNQTLFFNKKIIILHFLDNQHFESYKENIEKLYIFLKSNIFLIVRIPHITETIKKILTNIVNAKKKITIINCQPINKNEIKNYFEYKINKLNVQIEKNAKSFLLEHYQNNLTSLFKTLNILPIFWPNNAISINQILSIIHNNSYSYPFKWNDAVLSHQKLKAINIIEQLFLNKYDPIILARTIQYDLITLITIKQKKKTDVISCLIKRKIWKNRLIIFENAIKKTNLNQLHNTLKLLKIIEINIKKNFNKTLIWTQLKTLSLIY